MKRIEGTIILRELEGGTVELAGVDGRRYVLVGGTFSDGEHVIIDGELEAASSVGIDMTGLPVVRVRSVAR